MVISLSLTCGCKPINPERAENILQNFIINRTFNSLFVVILVELLE